ncbi:MAG: hypothetical protein KJ970_02650 [Candidatus Eisenbacteria bacterium]|uniref:Uncharacterized protein n=1 Tax=Eiseniibacteriota bacterium TaxID=2212470 RepID=A0A948W4X2_UNCEI|nr:hypothetical protein [Candidatus Eisenbacteria bacterium]MBU1951121.1 hypothetical protein [Candidatus Eisenbacteria bacterium]MBU2689799.1 hypothetical protein [Candidatus Eisenbacteria bacterium]
MSPVSKPEKPRQGRLGLLSEFFEFIRVRRSWWLAPLIVILVLLGVLLVFAQSSPLAPFIYALF